MANAPHSPRITGFTWGRITIEGDLRFRDAKLWPGGGREWNWAETGTRHEPGIQPADVEELVEHGAEVVVLTRGVHERLQVCPETLQALAAREIPVHVLQTERAVDLYNEFAVSERVGGLFHSTC